MATRGDPPVRVLLVDDDRDDYLLTRDLFAEIPGDCYRLDWVSDYDAGLAALCQGEHDVYLVDYRLGPKTGAAVPESRGTTRLRYFSGIESNSVVNVGVPESSL